MFKRSSVLKTMFAIFAAEQVIKILADDRDLEKDPSLGAVALGLVLIGAMCIVDDVKAGLGLTTIIN